jgi:hypothetical protein
MREIFLSIALMHPCEVAHESRWVGCEVVQVGCASGWCVKAIVWGGGSVVVEVGRWNRRYVVQTVW